MGNLIVLGKFSKTVNHCGTDSEQVQIPSHRLMRVPGAEGQRGRGAEGQGGRGAGEQGGRGAGEQGSRGVGGQRRNYQLSIINYQ